MPLPRTEVSAATVGNEIVVLGGFTIDRGASTRVDAYSPSRNSWRRLPDLPVGVHHSMAVGAGGKVYVLGGYTVDGLVLRSVFVLDRGRWRSLPRMPFPRAAAGAAVAGGKIVVAGGVTIGASRLARNALSFDLKTRRWSVVPGPTPREHLAVTSLGGTVYAVAGRTSGLDTNLLHFESYRPGDRSWRRLAPVPDARGGTGAAALSGHVVSVGGEEPDGTIEEVLAYRISDRRWVQLDDLRDAAARSRRCRARRTRLRDRRRPRARPHGQLRERGAAHRRVDPSSSRSSTTGRGFAAGPASRASAPSRAPSARRSTRRSLAGTGSPSPAAPTPASTRPARWRASRSTADLRRIARRTR